MRGSPLRGSEGCRHPPAAALGMGAIFPAVGWRQSSPRMSGWVSPQGQMGCGSVWVREAVKGTVCACVLGRESTQNWVQPAQFHHLLGQHPWWHRARQGPAEQRGLHTSLTFPPYSQFAATGRTQAAPGQLYLSISCCCDLVWLFTLPIVCVSMCVPQIELKSLSPPRQRSCCRHRYTGGRLGLGKLAENVCSSELNLPRRFGPHPALR